MAAETGASGIEVVRPPAGRLFRCALLDFDGTLSLIREGWQGVMIPMMVEVLTALEHAPSREELTELVREDVTVLTGRETIHQMIRLAERVRQFGGEPEDPAEYKRRYLDRLMERIEHRRRALAEGARSPEDFLLRGARAMLASLRRRGLRLYLTSGTDEPFVVEEARLLDVARYFNGGVYGARDDERTFTKAAVIQRMLRENAVEGAGLLGIGDGFVEIEETRKAGGYAVGVASDELGGGGRADAWKRDRLLRAGADMIVPDFADSKSILAALFAQENPRP